MRILLFGKNGQLGWELQRSLAPLGEVISLGRDDALAGDFTQPSRIAATVRSVAPDVIVNAAAYTDVDKAENEQNIAMLVNGVTPGVLGEVAASLGSWVVHYSTDYVFDGTGITPWREHDTVGPLNEYGYSKLAGEKNIRDAGCRHLIFRTSWLYARHGGNFARTMLKLAQEQNTLKVVNDQFGAPTGAELVADVTAHAIRTSFHRPELGGTYHLAAAGETTWFGYANRVISRARKVLPANAFAVQSIKGVLTTEFPRPANRPANSRLDTQKLRSTFNLELPEWQSGVDRLVAELFEN